MLLMLLCHFINVKLSNELFRKHRINSAKHCFNRSYACYLLQPNDVLPNPSSLKTVTMVQGLIFTFNVSQEYLKSNQRANTI